MWTSWLRHAAGWRCLRQLFCLLLRAVIVNRTPWHRVFSRTFEHTSSLFTSTAWLKVSQRVSHKNVFIHMSPRVWLCVVSSPIDLFLSFGCLYLLFIFFLYPGHHPPCGRNRRVLNPLRTRRMRSIAPWRYTTLSQVMSPTSSTTPSSRETCAVILRQSYHSHEESLLPAQSFFTRTSTGRPVYEPSSSQKRKSSRDLETSKSGFSLKDKKSKFLLKSDLRTRSTNFKPSLTEEVSRNQLELLILSEWKLIILLQDVSNPGKINY